MARKRHSPEMIAGILRKAESGVPVAQLGREAGVHENTIHLWKKKYGRLGAAKIPEMNELRDENTRKKRPVADLSLDKAMLQDVLSKSSKAGQATEACRRSPAAIWRESTTGELRAAIQSFVAAISKRNSANEVLRARIKQIAESRVRYGYRRIHVLLRREGWNVNAKRVARYTLEDLNLRAKGPKRRRRSAAQRVRLTPAASNHVWSMDFMHDTLKGEQRRKFRLLNVVDVFTRECLAIEVAPGV